MRTAIYARYSSENQRETSIADQFHLADVRMQREDWLPALRFSDSEVSAGTPTLLRPGGRALMEAIRAGRVDVLLIESLDRCWRDIVDQERTIREMERLGVRIIGISDGYDSEREGRELQRVIIGGVNQQYLRDLGKKVHRGLTGQTERGYHAGGLSYGYRTRVAGLDAKGEPIGHYLEVHEEQAKWVRWCFEHYAEGWAPRRIVYELNRLGVPSPRGSSWAISALYGQPKYGTGVLRNELYRGMYIWNRSQWVKDPDTGRRRRLERSRDQWQTRETPALRIVSEELWTACAERINGPKRTKPGKPKRAPLSGLLKCGHCGGSVTAVTAGAYGCTAHKDRGPTVCAGVRVKRAELEAAVLGIARSELLDDEAITVLRQEVATLQRTMHREHETAGRAARTRLATVDREIARLVDAVAAAGWSQAVAERLKKAEAERRALQADLVELPAPAPPNMIPRLIEHYQARVSDLPALMATEPAAAREALGELLGEIELTQDESGAVWAQVAGFGGLILNMVAGEEFGSKNPRKFKAYRVA
jgi:DNA invertase Pin-like site-specific DNA recombinase